MLTRNQKIAIAVGVVLAVALLAGVPAAVMAVRAAAPSEYTAMADTNFADPMGTYNYLGVRTPAEAKGLCDQMGDACLGYNSHGTAQKHDLLAAFPAARKTYKGMTYYVRNKYAAEAAALTATPW